MNTHDLVIDLLPKNTDDERQSVLRLIAGQPDAALLRRILGLDPITVNEPKPTRGWCELHNQAKVVRKGGGAKCRVCDNARRSEQKRRQRAEMRTA